MTRLRMWTEDHRTVASWSLLCAGGALFVLAAQAVAA